MCDWSGSRVARANAGGLTLVIRKEFGITQAAVSRHLRA
jgi:hypothetical protein